MPRKGRRSQAAKARWRKPDQEQQAVQTSPPARGSRTIGTQPPCSLSPVNNTLGSSLPGARFWRLGDARADFCARRGTGYRHRVQAWPVSPFTGHQQKLVIPPESPDKKFVLIVGDSHLRAIVDGAVEMPEERFSFGVMSTPGAAASALRTEVLNASLPRIPDAVCLLAPSNNLTASRTIDEAAVDYVKLLLAIRSRWPNVFVVDFPPRLNCEVSYQTLLRQEFHRVSARMGVKYFSAVEYFPLNRPELWSRDGVHLSDDEGMGILVSLLLSATTQHLETPPPAPRVSPRLLPRPRKFSPKKVVKGEVRAPQPPAPKRQLPRHVRKTSHHGKPSQSQGSPKPRMAQQQEEECFFPLNPVWFSSAALQAMEEVSPSHLSCTVDYKPSPKHKGVASSASARRPRVTARPRRRHRAPVNKLVGSPPSRVSWSSEEEAPLSPISLPQASQTVSPVRRPCTEERQPSGSRSPVNDLVGSPPARFSLSSGDAATPCSSPAAKMAKFKTPSPTAPSWTIRDAGCSPRSPAKTPQKPTPPSTAWPWLISDAPSTSRSPANEWMTSVLTEDVDQAAGATSSITKNPDHRPRSKTSRGPQLRTVLPSRQVFNALYYWHTSSCHICLLV